MPPTTDEHYADDLETSESTPLNGGPDVPEQPVFAIFVTPKRAY
jgi:hypothetical protein